MRGKIIGIVVLLIVLAGLVWFHWSYMSFRKNLDIPKQAEVFMLSMEDGRLHGDFYVFYVLRPWLRNDGGLRIIEFPEGGSIGTHSADGEIGYLNIIKERNNGTCDLIFKVISEKTPFSAPALFSGCFTQDWMALHGNDVLDDRANSGVCVKIQKITFWKLFLYPGTAKRFFNIDRW